MSVQRSPKKTLSKAPVSAEGSSSSQPDLSTLAYDLRGISSRKRKTPECDCATQLDTFRKEMLDILKQTTQLHNDNVAIITQNTTSIKEQLEDIKSTTEYLLSENNELKSEIKTLKDSWETHETKFKELENKIAKEKKLVVCEDLLSEIQDRADRCKNVIFVGVPEQTSLNWEERQIAEIDSVEQVLGKILKECPKLKKVSRIGKYNTAKIRPLKVCFESEDIPGKILRSKNRNSIDEIRIYPDQTPQQRQYYNNLRDELKARQEKEHIQEVAVCQCIFTASCSMKF
ncbi:unnamed protein product [Leptosia nina]|uniref:Transposase n=1 Tax=Leptosia nina TaxID=320188 RepID=A0AAV1J6B3_9NEOP